ncbi:MAG: glycosyltransferase family 4 protein [Veillonellaceae bacterium]|jgi:glycosyltransferase involved in cell wall biosynthesis|nr:glycosyltransferase family 4 protein [Veillonellaceae bacterium]
MRILIWCTVISIGGGSRLLTNLLKAFASNPEVASISLVISSETQFKERTANIDSSKINIVYWEDSPAFNNYINEADVVYCFWPHGQACPKINKPYVITYHDTTILDHVPPFVTGSFTRQYWETSKDWLDTVTKIVVSSEHVKSRLIAHFGEKCREAAVVPHAISPAKAFADVPTETGLNLPAEYIIYPANTSPHKNHYNLLLAYSKFAQRKKLPLVLFGYLTDQLRKQPPEWPEIAYLPTLTSLIKRVGLEVDKDLYPLGYIGDSLVTPLIKKAKALIMPSLSEGGGSYPVEEALNLGIPVLCSDIPVMREQLAKRSAKVIWFDPESYESILAALDRLVTKYDKYKKSAVKGSSDITYNWDDVARQYLDVFRSAINDFNSENK